jgi:hypothetical protein
MYTKYAFMEYPYESDSGYCTVGTSLSVNSFAAASHFFVIVIRATTARNPSGRLSPSPFAEARPGTAIGEPSPFQYNCNGTFTSVASSPRWSNLSGHKAVAKYSLTGSVLAYSLTERNLTISNKCGTTVWLTFKKLT